MHIVMVVLRNEAVQSSKRACSKGKRVDGINETIAHKVTVAVFTQTFRTHEKLNQFASFFD